MSEDADRWMLPSQGLLDRVHRVLAWVFGCYAAAAASASAALAVPTRWGMEARISDVAAVVLGAALLGAAAAAAVLMANGARRVCRGAATRPIRLLGRALPVAGGTGRLAQGVLAPLLAAAAASTAGRLHWPPAPADLAVATALGGLIVAAAFPALLAERFVAAVPPAVLPEAPALRRMLAVPVAALLLAGTLEVLRGQDLAWPGYGMAAVGAGLALLAAELVLRGLSRWFQPPVSALQSRAPIGSLLVQIPAWFVQPGGLATPMREHFGLDFSRSWALVFLRRATLPAAILTALTCWALGGVVLLPPDARGVYERFGDPVAVLGPGLHVTLPWPLGRVRPVEFGAVHEVPLGPGAIRTAALVPPEAPAPASADRLWDEPHPGEADWLIAGGGAAGQSFQVMSADIRVLYRIGLSDADAIHALYGATAPDTLVRELAGRTISRFFAGRTLASVLDQRREGMAAELDATLAAALDRPRSGLELVSVTVEAVHPPAGAAAAYHAVQAAEIIANTGIATETGRAKAAAIMARTQARDLLDKSAATAAETLAAARADGTRFAGDRGAQAAGGQSFLLDRYLQTISASLAKSPLTILDHRIDAGSAPVIDLRPFAPAARTLANGD